MNLYPPAPTTIVFAGIPIGVAYAQEPPITHAIRTALGSAPIPCAIDRQIGTIRAVVAVFDIKFVRIQQRMNTTNVNMYYLFKKYTEKSVYHYKCYIKQ
mgnify:CR=1 FL=1